MELETFFEQFELLADAPNGVQKLRELILQLAVQGKLVPQDSNDEPASVLLERIEAEKEWLIKEGKIKKSEKLPQIKTDELPFELPSGWQWVRMQNIFTAITDGDHQPPPKVDVGIPFLVISNVRSGFLDFTSTRFVSEKYFFSIDESRTPRKGDILYTVVGSYGIPVVVETENPFCIQRHIAILKPSRLLEVAYLKHLLKSELVFIQATNCATGIAQKTVPLNGLRKIVVPLPPADEQKRIAAKVDRLMSLCDELEARQEKRHKRILQLGEVATSQLLTPSTPEAFNQHWQGICDNFDLLYSTPENVSQLRQAILQLAVMGKLLPHAKFEPNLRKISQGKRVSDFIKILNGYAFKSQWFVEEGIRLLRNANVGHGTLRWDDVAEITEERAEEFKRFKLDVGDIVISLDRPLISTGLKVARVSRDDLPCLLLQRVGKVEFKTNQVLPEFFFLWLNSPIFINAIDPGRSNGVPHISSKSIESLPFAPPSLDEQKRIIAKVDRLMSFCDELEAKLTQSISDREKLMETAVRQVFAA